jgi:hypothetical protein
MVPSVPVRRVIVFVPPAVQPVLPANVLMDQIMTLMAISTPRILAAAAMANALPAPVAIFQSASIRRLAGKQDYLLARNVMVPRVTQLTKLLVKI